MPIIHKFALLQSVFAFTIVLTMVERKMKVGIAVQGGGTRGIFAAGALDVLMEEKITFPYAIGTSAGALALANFLSGDHGRTRYIISTLIGDPKFVSVRNRIFKGTVFDFNYLFYEIPKKESSFNFEAFKDNPTKFGAVATSLETGLAKVFYKDETPDIFAAMAASSSLPLLSRPVYVEGHPYLDGGPACSIPFEPALNNGMDKVLVISTRAKGFRKVPDKRFSVSMAKAMYKDHPEFCQAFLERYQVYNALVERMERLEQEGRLLVIYPEKPPVVGVACKDGALLDQLYEEGYWITRHRLDEIKKFLRQ